MGVLWHRRICQSHSVANKEANIATFLGFGDSHDGIIAANPGTVNSYAACTGSAGARTVTTSLTVVPGDIVLLHQSQKTGAGAWEVVVVASAAAGQFNACTNLANSYVSGAQAVLIPQYRGGTISGSLTGSQWAGSTGGIIFIVVNGKLTVSGTVSADGYGFRGGDNVWGSDPTGPAYQGESQSGAGSASRSANGMGGGGSYKDVNNAAGGGGGGHKTSGGNGSTTGAGSSLPGLAGGTGGNAALTTMLFGGAGGGSANFSEGSSSDGGDGGGIIVIFARELEVTGSITADGDQAVLRPGNVSGGSGAGGSVLIKCVTAILGTNKITASGGAAATNSGAGGSGRVRVETCSYTGSANDPAPSYSTGGHDFCGSVATILAG